jgi:hypothetical protein
MGVVRLNRAPPTTPFVHRATPRKAFVVPGFTLRSDPQRVNSQLSDLGKYLLREKFSNVSENGEVMKAYKPKKWLLVCGTLTMMLYKIHVL